MAQIEVPVSELQKNKIFLATPCYGGMCGGMFARSVADLAAVCTRYQIQLQIYFLFNESLITRARNYACDEFMRSGASHLLFIDADIGFDANDVIGMLALQRDESPYDIIGAPYPKKTISWEKIKMAVDKGKADKNPNDLEKYVGDYVFNPKGGQNQIPINEPVEVLEIGTGFMMVRKAAMEKFATSYPQYMYRPDHVRTEHFDGSREIMQFFQAEIDKLDYATEYRKLLLKTHETGALDQIKIEMDKLDEEAKKRSKRYLSEDYWFCQKAQAIGLKTFMCPWMKLSHTGTYVFGGSLLDLAQIGAPATADSSQLGKNKTEKI